jgi:hypothetical protein
MRAHGITKGYRTAFVGLLVGLLFCSFAYAGGYQEGRVQVSIFHRAGYGAVTSGFGAFGNSPDPPGFSWGHTFVQPNGPETTTAFAGLELILRPDFAGYSIRDGTGIWQKGGEGFSPASTNIKTSGTFFWYPDQPGSNQGATGIVFVHYIIQGHVGSSLGDYAEFTSDVLFNTAASGQVSLHLHYKNDQPGATFSGVDLYAQAPFFIKTTNGNGKEEFDMVENTLFQVNDPGEGSLSGVGNLGPATPLAGSPTATPVPIAQPARAQNIATRERVLNGNNVLIGGFIVTGSQSKKVLIRGIGPSTGLAAALVDPTLEVRDSANQLVASNDNWKINDQTGQSQEAEIQATTIPPPNDLESAIIVTLSAGNSAYTAILRGKGGATGIGLVEVYDLDSGGGSQLANLSTRGFVDTGENVLIGGVIIGPNSSQSSRVVLRAIGPSLTPLGIDNALLDPTLELHNANGALIRRNDNWKINDETGQSQQAEIQGTSLAPSSDLESAIASSLIPGNYTAIVAGKNGGTGVGVVEVYNLQQLTTFRM